MKTNFLFLLLSVAPLLWPQQSQLVLPELRVEVEPGELPGWETLEPNLIPLVLPSLEPRLPPLPDFDPSQPQWLAPPSLTLPRDDVYRQPPYFDEHGVRGLFLLGLGSPLLSIVQFKVEQRQPQLHALVGFDSRSRNLGSAQSTSESNFGLRFGGGEGFFWEWGLDADQTIVPLWGLGDEPLDRLEHRRLRMLGEWGLIESWLGLKIEADYRDQRFDKSDEDAYWMNTGLGFWLRGQPHREWRLSAEALAGAVVQAQDPEAQESYPTFEGRGQVDYLSAFWGLNLSGSATLRRDWEATIELEAGIYPLPWELRLFGRYLQQRSTPTQSSLNPGWLSPIDRQIEAGGSILWSSQLDTDLWLMAGWRLFYQWGLAVHRWGPSPQGLAQAQELARDRQISELSARIRTNGVDVDFSWTFDFLARNTQEESNHLNLNATFTLQPASLGFALDWGSRFVDVARLDVLMRFQTAPNWQLEASLEDVLLSITRSSYRLDLEGFRQPGFGGYLGLRYSW